MVFTSRVLLDKPPQYLHSPVAIKAASKLTQEKFENSALFLRLGLPSTLFTTEFENAGFYEWRGNFSKTELFENDGAHMISLTELSSHANPI